MNSLIEQHRRIIHRLMVLAPLLIGAYPITGLINPFWGSLFGFPLYAAARGHPVYADHHPWTEIAAFLVWPLVVIAGIIWLAGAILDLRAPWRAAPVTIWLLSALAVVPVHKAAEWFPGWPVYCACE